MAKELAHYGISRACHVLKMSKSVFYYTPLHKDDKPIEEALLQKAEKFSEEGFWMAYERLRKEGKPWTIKEFMVYIKSWLKLKA